MMQEADRKTEGEELDFAQRVEAVLADKINPALAMHGGWVRLERTEGRDVYLELGGGCKGCPGARMTMRYVVEDALRQVIPDIGQVIDATGH
jgi:Fe-S cluster biogenesis protein NfuA